VLDRVLLCHAFFIDQIIDNVRRLARDLSPSTLEDLGLSASLRWMAEGFAKYCNMRLSIQIEDIDHLYPPEKQIIIYRILQEGLTNIGKHARAQNASVTVQRRKKQVVFRVEDDGKGFDAQKTIAGYALDKGMGLAAIGERSRMLGGRLDISSSEGKGTRIHLTVSTV
jgi:signal transduction histidine kinase